MKIIHKILFTLLTVILLSSCETTYRFVIDTPKKVILEDEINVSIKEENGQPFKKVLFFVNGKEVASKNGTFTLDTNDHGVGKQIISAMVYFGEGKSKRINHSVEIFSNIEPTVYTGKIINFYPHDPKAFTQGLEYHNGFLYESTGKKGQSTISKINLKTGEVLKRVQLEDTYFGEGMTILNDKIYALTWQAKKGFIYDLETFNQEKEFAYGRSKEGWGLTNNGSELIKSDGSHKIWFLDAKTQKEKRFIQAYYDKGKIDKLNELEMVNGKLYANRWITEKPIRSLIVIINPNNGVVEGLINLQSLREEILKSQKIGNDAVLNGIAFDTDTNRLFVTGKNWGKIFEIELIKQ